MIRITGKFSWMSFSPVIGDTEKKKLRDEFKSALCISLQIDGSVDRGNQDMKYVVAKYVTKDQPTVLRSRFIGVSQPESKGAKGLLEVTVNTCEKSFVPTELLVGVTTDGEAANSGRESGLWKLLEDYLGHKLLTVWCYCHRSDLAVESALELVPELKMWMSNITGTSRYFRTSPAKLKKMQQMFPEYLSFPPYFEFWQELIADPEPSMRREKATAAGMLKTWDSENSLQRKQTCLMADITAILQTLQKHLQKGDLILPDVITVRNNALRKLLLMVDNPFPRKRRKIGNMVVTTGVREWSAVRKEVVLSFINFLEERLNIEESSVMKAFTLFLNAKTPKEMIDGGRTLVENIFSREGKDAVSEFSSNVCDCWPQIEQIGDLDISDIGIKMSYKLRKLISATTGVLQRFSCVLMVLSPHSMTVEKVISHHNQIKLTHRMSTSEETINAKMFIALNGIGTAHYDPRLAVDEFFAEKGTPFPGTRVICLFKQRIYKDIF
ncbi:zinc finger protein 862-like [Onthophagus taurus]|uniref:zinc finger protein 862-like n=1 Tax=Onthophagus taurus TaxID=166361 RepID=UPI0039BE3D9B